MAPSAGALDAESPIINNKNKNEKKIGHGILLPYEFALYFACAEL